MKKPILFILFIIALVALSGCQDTWQSLNKADKEMQKDYW